MYALVKSGTIIKYPYDLDSLRRDNPDVSFPSPVNTETLRRFGVVSVAPVDMPDAGFGAVIVEGSPALVDGEWVQTWNVSLPAPSMYDSLLVKRATRYQVRAALLQAGGLDDVMVGISALPIDTADYTLNLENRLTQESWSEATYFEREGLVATQIGVILGLTSAQVDDLFRFAVTIA